MKLLCRHSHHFHSVSSNHHPNPATKAQQAHNNSTNLAQRPLRLCRRPQRREFNPGPGRTTRNHLSNLSRGLCRRSRCGILKWASSSGLRQLLVGMGRVLPSKAAAHKVGLGILIHRFALGERCEETIRTCGPVPLEGDHVNRWQPELPILPPPPEG